MQRPRFLPSLRVLSIAGLLPVLLVATPADTTCVKKKNGCKSTTVFSVYPGNDVICVQGHPVVQIDSSASCGDVFDGSTMLLRCGTNASPFSYTGWAYQHTLSTSTNWETVLNGACGDMSYLAFPW